MSEKEKEENTAAQEAEEQEGEDTSQKRRRSNRRKGKVNATGPPTFKGGTEAIRDHVFVHNQIHTKKWITSRKKFITYAAKTYGGNEETSLEMRELTIVTMDEPIEPTEDELKGLTDLRREFTKDSYKQDMKIYKDIMTKTRNNLTKLYKVLWDQCNPIMHNKIKAHKENYTKVHATKSVIGLLTLIEMVCEQGDSTRNRRVQRFLTKKKVYNFRQTDEMDLGEYLEKFEVLVNVAEKNGARFYDIKDIQDVLEEQGYNNMEASGDEIEPNEEIDEVEELDKTEETDEKETKIKTEPITRKTKVKKIEKHTKFKWGSLTTATQQQIKSIARDRALAILFFMNANESKYAIYKQDCHNAMTKGRDEYPKSLVEAHTELEDFKFNPRLYQVNRLGGSTRGRFSGHQFLIGEDSDEQDEGTTTTTRKWRPKGHYICHNCDRENDCIASDCPHTTKENGDPTRDERRKAYNQSKEKKESAQCNVMEGSDNNSITEGQDDEWETELDGDDYDIQFYMNHTDEVLVEDLRGKNKHAFNQCKKRLNPKWILIDNCSSVNVFYNKRFLKNIRSAPKVLHLYTNAGKAVITQIGDLPRFGEVYFYPEGIANILSFHIVTNMPGYIVQYHNGVEDAFKVTNPNGKTQKFVPSNKGLYYWDSSETIASMSGQSFTEIDLEEIAVETIKGNQAKFSRKDNATAIAVRKLQAVTNWSNADMIRAIKNGTILNNPFTPRDVTIMNKIFGTRVAGLQGKMVRQKRKELKSNLTAIPQTIMDHYMDLTVSIDIMKVNKIPFMVTISKHIHYGTANPIEDMTEESLFKVLQELQKFYQQRGFRIGLMLADKQFECLDNELAGIGILLNIAAQDEHVPEVERFIRVIKERARCAFHNTPFKKIPNRMVIGLIGSVMVYINGISWEGGVSKILSPMTIVTGKKLDYKLHCDVPYGTYAQVRRGTDNTLKTRTFGAIAMGPMHNLQGGMIFMSLTTGRKVERDRPDYHILPMPDEVIDQVNTMEERNPEGLLFTDGHNNEIIDDDTVVDDTEDTSVSSESSRGSTVDPKVTSDDEESTGVYDSDNEDDSNTEDNAVEDTGVDDEIEIIFEEDSEMEENTSENEDEYNTDENETGAESDSEESDTPKGRPTRQNIQPYIWPGYEDAYINIMTGGSQYKRFRGEGSKHRSAYQYLQRTVEFKENVKLITSGNEQHNYQRAMEFLGTASQKCQDKITHFLMTQYGLKAGLEKFGDEGKAATTKEMKQMLSREVFEEIEYKTLSNEDKRLALPILLFLTRKRDGSIKGRACADGRKQRIWMTKEDTRSPTVSTEGLFYLLMMDAYEGRDVATLDLPGHFLQTPMEGRLILRVDGELALALVELDNERWKPHLQKVRGKWVIFVKCSKAIYGTLNAALLSYKKLIGHLSEWEFIMNPYDPCVWNKTIDGKQMTVAFHVDDMKISHVDPNEVTKIINKLKAIYGKTDPMTEVRGKVHEYLGMTINFRVKGEVKISMYDYIQKMLNDLKDDMKGEKPTAAPEHLFRTAPDDENNIRRLNQDEKDYFHTMTARALYLGKRGRPDLQTAVTFLCTRVRNPDEHDYKKLGHLMKYLQGSKHLPLILRYDGKEISLYIDGAHAVHENMRGHVGVMVTGGRGTIYGSSNKTKLNTTSSTKTEIIAVGEKLPKHIWFQYFRLAQGGNSDKDVLYQDNEAAILLANNGRLSCGKGSKHIHIRYFFVTDRIKRKEIVVRHCPMKEMIADYYTKPVQGALFRKFRNLILGINDEHDNQYRKEYEEAMDRYGLTPSTEGPE